MMSLLIAILAGWLLWEFLFIYRKIEASGAPRIVLVGVKVWAVLWAMLLLYKARLLALKNFVTKNPCRKRQITKT